jgi:hypothetical protein
VLRAAAAESANTSAVQVPTLETEEVPTLEDQPTLEPGVANAEQALALPPEEVLATPEEALAIEELEQVDVANTEIEVPTRHEPRRNKQGKLRGIAWRERNKGRKAVWYVGAKSKGQRKEQWERLKGQFE